MYCNGEVLSEREKSMNKFKYLLLSVATISIVYAQEPVKGKATKAATQGKEAVIAKTEAPVAPVKQVAQVDEKAVAEDQDDFADWVKGLEMSDDEKSQFLSEMNEEIDPEVEKISEDVQDKQDVTSVFEDKKTADGVEKVKVKPEPVVVDTKAASDEAQVDTEMPLSDTK